MGLPAAPVTLTPDQIAELSRKIGTLRHDVNNHLLLIMASAELLQLKPESAPQMIKNMLDQPTRVTEALNKFSQEFEKALGITRG
jgi:hypothetical protein